MQGGEIIIETECVRYEKKIEDFSKMLEDFLQNWYKSHQNIDVWKLQSGKMIIETECVRFAK